MIVTESDLIFLLKKHDRTAQKQVFDKYSKLFFHVCRRYLSLREEAEEALLNGFFKAFSNIDSFSGGGSFEGWLRRIMINESLMMLRSRRQIHFPMADFLLENQADDFNIEAELSAREILELLEKLPEGCRTIFNLYVIEGMKHQEIADLLQISINTSKSQLILARQKLSLLIEKHHKILPKNE